MKNSCIMIGSTSHPNGPNGVFKSLSKEFSNNKDIHIFDFNETSKLPGVFKMAKKILTSRNAAICVHQEGYIIPIIVYLLSFFNKSNKYYCVVHGMYYIGSKFSGNQKWIYVQLEKLLLKKFPNLICVSSKLQKDIGVYINRRRNVFVIYNGTEMPTSNKLAFDNNINETLNFISVGGIKQIKGIFEMLILLKKIKEETDIEFTCKIYGGKDSDELLSKFNKFILDNDFVNEVEYLGVIDEREEVFQAYKNAHFNLCMSKYDTFNVAVLESMSVGCLPIVSTDCGAADLVDDNNGIVFDYLNPKFEEEISRKICKITSNRERLAIMVKNAMKTAEKHNWSVVAKQYLQEMEILSDY